MLGTPVLLVAALTAVAEESSTATGNEPGRVPVDAAAAAQLFEKFKSLEGDWNGKSTKGWTDRLNFRTIAGGSVVVETSFDAHPGETMLTMFHLDGDRLLLTHYCVSGNQPRLVATGVSPDGNAVTFEFLDVTGIASRDEGHMDKAVFRFEGPDRMTSHWTWYQKGQERWLEEIVNVRAKSAP